VLLEAGLCKEVLRIKLLPQ